MTIKLKCPYSEEELEEIKKIRNNFTNTSVVCPFCGGPVDYKNELSIALMQSQHDLEIARKAADNSREKLAAFMHDTWGNWFAYQLKNSTVENLQRWGIQANTPYSSLTETDKDKDRKFADEIIEIIKEQIEHKE